MLEHPPTYTLGRRTRPGDLPHDRDYYRERGTAVRDTPRGGQVTWHRTRPARDLPDHRPGRNR